MKKIAYKIKVSLTIAVLYAFNSIVAYEIDHLEPPFGGLIWKKKSCQLLVHGKNISFTTSNRYENVEITGVKRTENNNYLFIDLSIKNANAGSFDIQFIRLGKVEAEYRYILRERSLGSKDREGFDPGDVIYLITPDRYANGDPRNDSVDGLKEKLKRNNKDGRHGGDIQGIIDHLGYIDQMGFTQLWLNPVLVNNQKPIHIMGIQQQIFTILIHVLETTGSI